MDIEDDDIFHMLLHENKNKTKHGNHTGPTETRTPSIMDFEGGGDYDLPLDLRFSIDSTSSQFSNKTESEILEHVHKQPQLVLDHCSDEDFLYVLVDNDNTAVVHMYRLDCDNAQKPNITGVLASSLRSTLFKSTDQERPGCRRLYLIHQRSSPNTELPSQSGNVNLPSSTYASLFGKTTGLVKSPVVLLCTNDGSVYWRPVKFIGQEGKFHLMCQLHDVVHAVLFVSVKEKSGIDENVAKTLQSALMMGDKGHGNGNVNGLLIVNPIGECCLMFQPPRQISRRETFPVRFYLPHPVMHCIHREQQFIYSTGWSVESATLCLKQEENRPAIILENCVTLKMAAIERLFVKTAPYTGSCSLLMGLTTDLNTVHIPLHSSSSTTHSPPKTHHLPDTIRHIQQHATSIQELKEKSDILDSHLMQLNLFANLFQQHQTRKCKTPNKSVPLLHCDCFLDHSVGNKNSSVIRIHVRNDSKINLSDLWSVLVTVVPECPVSEAKLLTDSYCFKMDRGFHSGHTKTFSVPLPECIQSDPLPRLSVHVSLVLCHSQEAVHHCQDSVSSFPSGRQYDMLQVEIHTQPFDCLHFLSKSTDASSSSNTDAASASYTIEEMRIILEKIRSKKCMKKSQNDAFTPGKKKFTSTILVPDFTDQESQQEVKEDALKMLLFKIDKFPDDNNALPYRSPIGSEIVLMLEKREAKQASGKISLQLRLESLDVILLCAVHLSLMEKFKLLQMGRQNTLTKMDLEKQLSALKASGLCISNSKSDSKQDEIASRACKTLDCLGTC